MNARSRSRIAAPLIIGGAALVVVSFVTHPLPFALVVVALYSVATGLIVLNDETTTRTIGILFAIALTVALSIHLSGRGATPASNGGNFYSYGEPEPEGGIRFYPGTPDEEPPGTAPGGYYSEPSIGI